MELNLFGFQIKKKGPEPKKLQSPISPTLDDGATISQTGAAYYSTVLDLDGVIKGENDLIRRYRSCAEYSDVDSAIEDIVNEAISTDDDEVAVSIVLDKVKVGDGIKKKIEEEFDNITTLLKFDERSHEIFRQWYIDGRIYYNVMVDKDNSKEGIKELRYVDPRKIRKIKIMKKEKSPSGVELVSVQEEYYLFNDKGVTESSTSGVKMSLDSVVYVPSGNFDANTGMALSFLNKAVKPTNQLKMLEDAMVIFRITRAPERRIFYVDVGNLPKMKAEQYVQDIMNKFKNKVVYDASTGEVRDNRKQMSMIEDFWMPRREGGKGTEITTLPGLQNANNIEDVTYFQTKLWQALNVPASRNQPGNVFSTGRGSEITRDEIKFSKFVSRLRIKFSQLFYELLRIQLQMKGIVTAEDWAKMHTQITLKYAKDNHYAEFKENEILTQRMQLLMLLDPQATAVGKYYSIPWIRKNVLRQEEEEMKEIDKEMDETAANNPPPVDNQSAVSAPTEQQ